MEIPLTEEAKFVKEFCFFEGKEIYYRLAEFEATVRHESENVDSKEKWVLFFSKVIRAKDRHLSITNVLVEI